MASRFFEIPDGLSRADREMESNRVVTRSCVALTLCLIVLGGILSVAFREWGPLLFCCVFVLGLVLASLALSLCYVVILSPILLLISRVLRKSRREKPRGQTRT